MIPKFTFILPPLFCSALVAQAPGTATEHPSLDMANVVSDSSYTTLSDLCTAAAKTHGIILITREWVLQQSLNCPTSLAFLNPRGRIRLIGNAVLTTQVPAVCITAGFDISSALPGSVLFTSDPANAGSNPRCFGALGDGANDDTASIQAAIDAVAGQWNGNTGYSSKTYLTLSPGTYKITAGLRIFKPGSLHPGRQSYESFQLRGAGKTLTAIYYYGPRSSAAIRAIGADMLFSDFSIFDRTSTGWLSAIDYDGDQSIGRSTESAMNNLLIDCLKHPGDGIAIGRSGFQADSLSVYHPEIRYCDSGRAVVTLNGNALSTVLYHPVVGHCWIGAESGTSTNMSIFGGEFDDNDLNFMPGAGSVFTVEGVRSENSRRTMFSGTGAYPQAFTLQNYLLASDNPARPSFSVTSASESTSITLAAPGFTFGDYVVIVGAGKGGADLHTKITNMANSTSATIYPPIATSVIDAPLRLDSSVNQNALEENGGGPYVHIANVFVPHSGATVSKALGPQIFIGNSWTMNITNPFGITGSAGLTPSVTLQGNWYNNSPTTLMPNTLPANPR